MANETVIEILRPMWDELGDPAWVSPIDERADARVAAIVEKIRLDHTGFSRGEIPVDDPQTIEQAMAIESSLVPIEALIEHPRPTTFAELVATIGILRTRPHLPAEPNFHDTALDQVLQSTDGVLIFRDQAIEALQACGPLNIGEATEAVRRLEAGDRLDGTRHFFISNQNGASGEEIWGHIAERAPLLQDRALTTRQAIHHLELDWLARNYPQHFCAVGLDRPSVDRFKATDAAWTAAVFRNWRQYGVRIAPPRINIAHRQSTVSGDSVVLGLEVVDGLSDADVSRILDERQLRGAFKSVDDFSSRADAIGLSASSIEKLAQSGALDEFGQSNSIADIVFLERKSLGFCISVDYSEAVLNKNWRADRWIAGIVVGVEEDFALDLILELHTTDGDLRLRVSPDEFDAETQKLFAERQAISVLAAPGRFGEVAEVHLVRDVGDQVEDLFVDQTRIS